MGFRINEGTSFAFIKDPETGNMYFAETLDVGVGAGTPAIGIGLSAAYFPNVNKPEDLNGWITTVGGNLKLIGGDIHFKTPFDQRTYGFRISSSLFPLTTSINMGKELGINLFDDKEIHISRDYSYVIWSKKLNEEEANKYLKSTNSSYEFNVDTIKPTIEFLLENKEKYKKGMSFKEAIDKVNEMHEKGYYD